MKTVRFILVVLLYCHSVLLFAQNETFTDTVQIDEIVVTSVTGSAHIKEIAAPISIISNAALQTFQSTNIIDAISRQPGVSQITTGSGISKPVIRGLGYNRVLVVNNGIRQEGQQWGDEHGIEIDGNAVGSIEIMKGPASLIYGSDAMAGVIIMNESPIMSLGKMHVEAMGEYQTNNGLANYSLNYKGNHNGFIWDCRWSQKFAHDYHAPQDGIVPNTGFKENAISGMVGLNKKWGYSRIKASFYNLTPEMTEVEDDYEEGSNDYSIEAPFQKVRHTKVISDNRFYLKKGYLNALIGYQQNRRQEYEDADECELDFDLKTITYDLRYVLPEWKNFKFNYGIGGMQQASRNLGEEFLIPEYNLFDVGMYITAHRSVYSNLHISGGIRYDRRNLHSFSLFDEGEERFQDFKRNFGAFSGSIGVIYNLNSKIDVKANVSHGYRAPNISELGCNGKHEGTFRYEQGNASLNPEHSWQVDAGIDFSSERVSASLSLFANRIGNYIYIKGCNKKIDDTPVFQYTSGDARVLGGEAMLKIYLLKHLYFENTFSIVDAQLLSKTDGKYLPFIPAPRLVSTLHYDIPVHSNRVKNFFVEVESDFNLKQDHIMSENDTETPTAAYVVLDATIGIDIHRKNGAKLCYVGLNATNLLNTAYQSHLSRLKYAETYSFTGRYGINNIGRNIGIKAVFPVDFEKKQD